MEIVGMKMEIRLLILNMKSNLNFLEVQKHLQIT